MNLLIIIPTYNEIENIPRLVPEVESVLSARRTERADAEFQFSILVVDDGSPDGTAAEVKKLQSEYRNLFLLERAEKRGLADAYVSGFGWGAERGFDVFLEMDADFSHRPEYVPALCDAIESGFDVAVGSRNVKGGSVEGWSALRNLISKGGSLYSRIVLGGGGGLPLDLTGGFNMWRRSALEKIGLPSLVCRGYAFQIEMKYRAFKADCRIAEVPIVFPDRQRGKSKMSRKIFFEALFAVWKIRNIKKAVPASTAALENGEKNG